MEPATKNLVLGDGQVEASSGVVLAGAVSMARRYNLTFTNVGTNTETLVLTYGRSVRSPWSRTRRTR